ncbi:MULTISPECIES: GAF and ANTAR domain-containing protein [Micromonospora]|uniref:GAF domain-containing protein n=1 Tax=Micromonospora vinacea TaxID=709878 RepID=A0ABS0JUZ9_9ACTN|nr:GAF and ANTAR domain-containing protein [Micromonospora vinacea]MBG6100187.1 GAF domain-containing protein [Micromonospora vinacea]WSZ76857.1 GAF and ANTAR domain-containing protein [Micromonospora sp. NBC_00860]WTA66664.1 GAF and ANTAR domain-containing protein [Micromonospora sp. NBC_00855]
MAQQPIDPNAAIFELGQIKLGETDLSGVLTQVSELARRTIPGAEEVSVTLMKQESAHTAAFSGEMALRLDELQYEFGQGPCLEAARDSAVVSVPIMSEEARWPQWATQAVQGGAHSSLSIGFTIQESVLGALNIYGVKPSAFDDEAVTLAQTFAGYAAVALANAHLYDATASLAAQMQLAMQSRAVIEQAKGIIMGERRCTPDEAFAVLAKVSQDSNRKLREVAAALVERATRPPSLKRDRGGAGNLP